MTSAAIAILAAWFAVSALAQLNLRFTKTLRSYDVFSVIPNWSFFAPRPGTSDYHLVFRDIDRDRNVGKWQEVSLTENRTLLGAIWNPQKRGRKVLSDVVRALVRLAQGKPSGNVSLTIPYLAVLNYVSCLPRGCCSAQTQFMILKSEGFFSKDDPQLVFVSNTHNLELR